jgi:hypothetical protein
MGGSNVTVEGAMEEMGLDYFTTYHIVKRLERDGELVLEEGVSGDRRWLWGEETESRATHCEGQEEEGYQNQ